jgi:multisubunit Na+/H+ antiporter MnhC subunit
MYNIIVCVNIYTKTLNIIYLVCGYMTENLSMLSEVFTALLMRILTLNAFYVIQRRNIPKMYHTVNFVKMVQEMKRVRTDM